MAARWAVELISQRGAVRVEFPLSWLVSCFGVVSIIDKCFRSSVSSDWPSSTPPWGVVACILTHLTRPRRFVLDVLRPRWGSRAGHNSHSIVPTASTRRATSFPNFAYSPVCRVVRKSRVSGQRAVCSVRTTLREYKACALYTVFSGV